MAFQVTFSVVFTAGQNLSFRVRLNIRKVAIEVTHGSDTDTKRGNISGLN